MRKDSSHNPDVLSCIANLSSDEVFTPPQMANQILDLLPAEIWSDPDARFLDPACKSGVFLREIAKRLNVGLSSGIPDIQERLNHIFAKQLYAIAITELTSLLARRSVYCSKTANGRYSVCESFDDELGNIRFAGVDHTWDGGHCRFCGTSQSGEYNRSAQLESHAYEFIHTDNPEGLFNMKFDVIVGNPPYQMSDGGFGRSASPIYHRFVLQAKKLNPRYLTMIIPARWFGGGKGLDEFRAEMLNDERLSKLVDFEDSSDVFPGVSVAGGICYFLWEQSNHGSCEVVNTYQSITTSSMRRLNEFDTFIRDSAAVPIIRKLQAKHEKPMREQVSSYKPFGLRTFVKPQRRGDIILHWQKGEGPYNRRDITAGVEMIDMWKVISSRSGHEHAGNPGKDGSRRVLAKIEILPPGTVCTETYLVIGNYPNETQALHLAAYMRTKFFRYLLSLIMYSHGITRDTYAFIPILDMNKQWTDEKLYKRYGLTNTEIQLIETRIRSMDAKDE